MNKKPRLFYWEEAIDRWVPVPKETEYIINTDCLGDGDVEEIQFKRVDMTDEEFDALPEG